MDIYNLIILFVTYTTRHINIFLCNNFQTSVEEVAYHMSGVSAKENKRIL